MSFQRRKNRPVRKGREKCGMDVKDSVLSGVVLLMRKGGLKGWVSTQNE